MSSSGEGPTYTHLTHPAHKLTARCWLRRCPAGASPNNNDAVSVCATFILADVALLFVAANDAPGFTCSEKAVVANMMLLIGLSVQHARGFVLGIPLWFTEATILIVSTLALTAITAYQYYSATRTNERVAEAIMHLDLDALDGL